MGLDMYLEKINRKAIKFEEELRKVDSWIEQEEKKNSELYQEMKPYIVKRGSDSYSYPSLSEEIGYWRKANHIHDWFVNNVQNGVDDCGTYEVTKEQLEELKSVCETVIASSKLVDGKVNGGTSWTKDTGEVQIWDDGKVMENSEVAEDILPTQAGFFFGATEYDEYYYGDVAKTIEFIDKALGTDFETYAVQYSSSW
jgi:hypothetical protein